MSEFSIHSIEISSCAAVTIQNMLAGTNSSRLVAMLPGLGYTVDAPLMHYLRKIAWHNNFDVLSIKYGFQVAQTRYEAQHQGAMTQESQQAIEQALAKGYDELIIVGKSLGTPMAAMLGNQFPQTTKLLLLTPIADSHKIAPNIATLAVIGTADPRYDEGLAVDTDNLRWKVYEDLDHSLEISGDILASITIMRDIMETCQAFLT
jgi:pimeloyl-ACP methyl ester carboxylesterase